MRNLSIISFLKPAISSPLAPVTIRSSIHAEDDAGTPLPTHVHGVLRGTAGEPELLERGVELRVPGPWSLAQPIEGLVEAEHLASSVVALEAWRLRNVHLFLQLTVQECRLDVKVMDLPALMCC
jgi:hypothetical protein